MVERTILGYGGAVEDCGALRLNEADEDGDEGEGCTCSSHRSPSGTTAALLNDQISSSRQPEIPESNLSTTAKSTALFDADFDLKLDATTGRWLVSNVNVLRRS